MGYKLTANVIGIIGLISVFSGDKTNGLLITIVASIYVVAHEVQKKQFNVTEKEEK